MKIEEVTARREAILRIAHQHHARNVRVFGSVVRGEETSSSDVDFLVDFDVRHSLLDRAALQVNLEELLGLAVDVATERVLRPNVRERVLAEAVAL